jgi:hypothetical protein
MFGDMPLSVDITSTNSPPLGSTTQTKIEPIVSPRQLPNPPTSDISRLASEAQESPSDLTTVLAVISHARLSPRERQAVADLSNLLVPDSLTTSDLARQGTQSPPPTYIE